MNKGRRLILIFTLVLTVTMTAGTFVAFCEENPNANEASPQNTETIVKKAEAGDEYKKDQVIVVFQDGVSKSKGTDIVENVGGKTESITKLTDENNMAVVKTPENKSINETMDELAESSKIKSVQPNYVYHINDEEDINKDKTAEGKSINDSDVGDMWYFDKIYTEGAWNTLDGLNKEKVKVAVLDTGVLTSHDDLQKNLNKELCVDAAVDNAETSYKDLPKITKDENGHGTMTTGLVGATANNNEGIAGIGAGSDNSIVDVFTVDVFIVEEDEYGNKEELAYTSDLIRGIQYAQWKGAKVINMSLGYDAKEEKDIFDVALEDAITKVTNNGITVVCAAGNDGNDELDYPAAFNDCISVINTKNYTSTSENCKSLSSNYGTTCDISAPGNRILSTYKNGYYAENSGTSFSSPIVAAVAAMIYYVNPDFTVDEVKDILYSTATDLYTEGFDDYTANGNVNAEAAVNKAETLADEKFLEKTLSAKASLKAYDKIQLTWSKVEGASGYLIYRYDQASNEYVEYKTINNPNTLEYNDSDVDPSREYKYKIKAFRKNNENVMFYSNESEEVAAVTSEVPATVLSAKTATYNSNKLTWTKVEGVTGYVIYRYDPVSKIYKEYKDITNGNTIAYINTGLKTGTRYYYKIKAYKTTSANEKVYSKYSSAVSAKPYLKKPVLKVKTSHKKAYVKWSKISGAAGYKIYRATKKNGKYKGIKMIKKASTVKWTNKSLKRGKRYYYKVRAYRIVSGKYIYSTYSSKRSVKVK